MGLYNSIVEQIILPGSDLLLRQSIAKHLRFLQKSRHWSHDELRAYQDEKLRTLIRHAYQNVPYYRKLLKEQNLVPDDIKSQNDLYKIPVLTKEAIRKNFPEGLVARGYPRRLTIPHKSSGSTGEPMQYLVSNDAYSFNIACNLRGWYWMGYRLGDRMVKISQYERSRIKKVQDVALRNLYLSSADLSETGLEKLVNALLRYNPKVIRCYPDPLFFITKYLQKNNITSLKPSALTTTGNVLRPDRRAFIESFFNCKIYDSYRCEGGANFFESPGHNGYINSMEYAISEIIADGSEVAPGGRGRHITTDLHNYAMPFIRYDSQDILVKSQQQQAGGMAHTVVKRIEGRDSDILVTKEGKYLIVIHFVDYFDQFSSVRQFQVQQNSDDKIDILLKVESSFTERENQQIYDYWDTYIGNGTNLEVRCVENIPIPPSGKRRFLVRNREIKLNI